MVSAIRHRRLVPADRDPILAEMRAWSPTLNLTELLPAEVFAQSDLSLLALDEDDVVAGFALALKSRGMPDTGYVHFIWVSPARRGEGLADAMYRELFELFRSAGCTHVEAVTAAANPHALALHERMGFAVGPVEEVNVGPGPAGDGVVATLVHLVRELGPDEQDSATPQ